MPKRFSVSIGETASFSGKGERVKWGLVIMCTMVIFFTSTPILFPRTRIFMRIDSNVEFDLSLLSYPPTVYPSYYFPTSASPPNPQGIRIRFGYQRRPPGGHSISNLYLATRASGDFSSTISLNQLFFAPDGEPLPSPGVDPPGGNWRPFSLTYQQIEQFAVSWITGNLRRDQDYIFQSEPDDEATNSSITIYYRVYGL